MRKSGFCLSYSGEIYIFEQELLQHMILWASNNPLNFIYDQLGLDAGCSSMGRCSPAASNPRATESHHTGM